MLRFRKSWLALFFLIVLTPFGTGAPKPSPTEMAQLKAMSVLDRLLREVDLAAKHTPELRASAEKTKAEFQASPLEESRKVIAAKLEASSPEAWKAHLAESARESEKSQSSPSSPEALKAAITNLGYLVQHNPCVSVAPNGEVSLQSAILAANPRYDRDPLLEIKEGWKISYQIPINSEKFLVLTLPASWTNIRTPGALGYFAANASDGPASIGIASIPAPPGIPYPLPDEFIPASLPEGATLVRTGQVKIGREVAYMRVINAFDTRRRPCRLIQYNLREKTEIISIMFFVNSSESVGYGLDEDLKLHEPLFKAIIADAHFERADSLDPAGKK